MRTVRSIFLFYLCEFLNKYDAGSINESNRTSPKIKRIPLLNKIPMEKISDRISIEEAPTSSLITIAPFHERWKQRLLLLWILLWSFCGLYVASRLFIDAPGNERIAYFVFLAFWTYFLYTTAYTALWRSYGQERIKISDEELIVEKGIGKRGSHSSIPISSITSVRVLEADESSFSQHFEGSYYVIGGMAIEIEHLGNFTHLGEKLSAREARNLLKAIDRILEAYRDRSASAS